MLWQCEKSLSEILFDSVLRCWYPGVLVNTGESKDQFYCDNPRYCTHVPLLLHRYFEKKYHLFIIN